MPNVVMTMEREKRLRTRLVILKGSEENSESRNLSLDHLNIGHESKLSIDMRVEMC